MAEEARRRPELETSEFWRREEAPMAFLTGFERVCREGPPRTFEVPDMVVIVVVDIEMGELEGACTSGAVSDMRLDGLGRRLSQHRAG